MSLNLDCSSQLHIIGQLKADNAKECSYTSLCATASSATHLATELSPVGIGFFIGAESFERPKSGAEALSNG